MSVSVLRFVYAYARLHFLFVRLQNWTAGERFRFCLVLINGFIKYLEIVIEYTSSVTAIR